MFRIRRSADSLLPREAAILTMLAALRVATADQLARVVFRDKSRPTSLRLAHRHISRLTDRGLIRSHPNLSPSHRSGPHDHVHVLTAQGTRVIGRAHGLGIGQRKSWHPSASRLEHWLTIGDLYVGLVEASQDDAFTIIKFDAEGDARRQYLDAAGRTRTIQPDAFVYLKTRDMLLSWFVEVDRGSENPGRISEKCRAYRNYELADLEYQQHGVFPGVMFIVPDEHRKQKIDRVIAAQPADARGLFWVSTETEAVKLLTNPVLH